MERRTVLITGASRGLGKELSLVFARNSWDLVINGRSEELLFNVASIVSTDNINCEAVVGDLRSEETIARLSEVARERNIDALINNAGIYAQKPFQEMGVREFREMIEVNLIAPALLIKEIYPIFQEKKSGRIVNVNSVAGSNACDLEAAYCASKHGLRGFSDSFKIEADRMGIRVIDIELGAMQTDMTRERANYDKLMRPSEVAEFIYGLCEDDRKSMRVDRVVLRRRAYQD